MAFAALVSSLEAQVLAGGVIAGKGRALDRCRNLKTTVCIMIRQDVLVRIKASWLPICVRQM